MIRRFDFGTPYDTGAVVTKVPVSDGPVPHFDVTEKDGQVIFRTALGKEDQIFGLGETVRGLNKRGHVYRSWNIDEFCHAEDRCSMYSSHNLVLFSGEKGVFGAYFDDPGAVKFDLGYTRRSEAVITSENGDLSVYIIDGDSLTELVREFRSMIGRSYLPPKWGMGYLQSRWGYASEEEISAIVENHRQRHIPLDGVCMDIDNMIDYKDFTWNPAGFPDMKGFTARMKDDHVRLVPIIDAGVKLEEGYDACDEGVEKNYFVKKEDGSLFIGAAWPGKCYFPDFMRKEVRDWFGDGYRGLLDAGVEGFWNDMNEPALFYSMDSLEEAYRKGDELRPQNLGAIGAFALKDAFNGITNNAEDYRRFYHQMEDGSRVRHDKVHNIYGAKMTQAAADSFTRYNPDKRHLLFSRSSFVGAHRDGGLWQGDNAAWWSHILLNLKMTASLNMCGFLFTGADLGGFSTNTTEDLLLRWLQLGVFTPLMRNHSINHARPQEIYRFDSWQDMSNIVSVRYALLPYLYSTLVRCAVDNDMMFRPMAFDYPTDPIARNIEDQIMLGEDCMIAPVYTQNALGRYVYLPEDMLYIRLRSATDYDMKKLEKGHHYLDLDLNEMPLFIRRGHVVPFAGAAEYVDAIDEENLMLLGWIDGGVQLPLYTDDGLTTDIDLEKDTTVITVTVENGAAVASAPGCTIDASKVYVG